MIEDLTEGVINIRKKILLDQMERDKIIKGYLVHFQRQVVVKNKGKLAMKYMEKCIQKSKHNIELLTEGQIDRN